MVLCRGHGAGSLCPVRPAKVWGALTAQAADVQGSGDNVDLHPTPAVFPERVGQEVQVDILEGAVTDGDNFPVSGGVLLSGGPVLSGDCDLDGVPAIVQVDVVDVQLLHFSFLLFRFWILLPGCRRFARCGGLRCPVPKSLYLISSVACGVALSVEHGVRIACSHAICQACSHAFSDLHKNMFTRLCIFACSHALAVVVS